FDTDAYANDGVGEVYGVETLLRLQAERTVGLVAFTWSRSSRIDRPGEEEELFRYDQPFTLNALVSHEFERGWRLGARVRASSGYPYTPVVNRYFELDSRTFVPVFGERSSSRLPNFFALDIRIDRTRTFEKWSLDTYLDLQNATNSVNPEVMAWTYDYSEEDPVPSNPLLPSFGLRAEW
ncbi:MAG: ligand-gated channel protein, partial [Myxococcota bacterium]|nr:ligand-gated channel protein [Myxococcota bacterium]